MTNVIAYPDELLDDGKLNAYYEHVINSIRPNIEHRALEYDSLLNN